MILRNNLFLDKRYRVLLIFWSCLFESLTDAIFSPITFVTTKPKMLHSFGEMKTRLPTIFFIRLIVGWQRRPSFSKLPFRRHSRFAVFLVTSPVRQQKRHESWNGDCFVFVDMFVSSLLRSAGLGRVRLEEYQNNNSATLINARRQPKNSVPRTPPTPSSFSSLHSFSLVWQSYHRRCMLVYQSFVRKWAPSRVNLRIY